MLNQQNDESILTHNDHILLHVIQNPLLLQNKVISTTCFTLFVSHAPVHGLYYVTGNCKGPTDMFSFNEPCYNSQVDIRILNLHV